MLGEDDLETATAKGYVGTILQDMGKSREAYPYLEQCLDIFSSLLGDDDPHTVAVRAKFEECLLSTFLCTIQ